MQVYALPRDRPQNVEGGLLVKPDRVEIDGH